MKGFYLYRDDCCKWRWTLPSTDAPTTGDARLLLEKIDYSM